MHIDVNDILRQGEGHQADFEISDERPDLEGITLRSPISGSIRLVGLDDGILAAGDMSTDIELECNRCLRSFSYHLDFPLEAEFMEHPNDDQFPIDKHGLIVLNEPLRQEIDLHLPLGALCQVDCGGIE